MNRSGEQSYAISNGLAYAPTGNYSMLIAWFERAARIQPFSDMQLYRIRQKLGPYKYQDLDIERFGQHGAYRA